MVPSQHRMRRGLATQPEIANGVTCSNYVMAPDNPLPCRKRGERVAREKG